MTSQAQTAPAARTITAKLRLGRGLKAEQPASDEGAHADSSEHRRGRIPRVARLMALAIRLDGMLQRGEVRSQRELAEVARVTPARLTQILNLLHLAPDIQEQLLQLAVVRSGRDPVTEHELRILSAEISWDTQRRLWKPIGQISSVADAP
jgi:hypothetical protein